MNTLTLPKSYCVAHHLLIYSIIEAYKNRKLILKVKVFKKMRLHITCSFHYSSNHTSLEDVSELITNVLSPVSLISSQEKLQ